MLDIVSSANIACGGHASDPETMYRTLRQAVARGVVIGAHPGYADREGFGRRVIPMQPDQIGRMVAAQVGALQGVAAVAALPGDLGLLAISGTELELAARAAGQPVHSDLSFRGRA